MRSRLHTTPCSVGPSRLQTVAKTHNNAHNIPVKYGNLPINAKNTALSDGTVTLGVSHQNGQTSVVNRRKSLVSTQYISRETRIYQNYPVRAFSSSLAYRQSNPRTEVSRAVSTLIWVTQCHFSSASTRTPPIDAEGSSLGVAKSRGREKQTSHHHENETKADGAVPQAGRQRQGSATPTSRKPSPNDLFLLTLHTPTKVIAHNVLISAIQIPVFSGVKGFHHTRLRNSSMSQVFEMADGPLDYYDITAGQYKSYYVPKGYCVVKAEWDYEPSNKYVKDQVHLTFFNHDFRTPTASTTPSDQTQGGVSQPSQASTPDNGGGIRPVTKVICTAAEIIDIQDIDEQLTRQNLKHAQGMLPTAHTEHEKLVYLSQIETCQGMLVALSRLKGTSPLDTDQ